MDFVPGLPLNPSKKNSVWVIIDRLTKSAHFLLVRTDNSLEKLVELYISKIVCLYGIPTFIVGKVYINVCEATVKIIRNQLRFSTAFHPQLDGQSERVIQKLYDRFWAALRKYLPLVEFEYNNSHHANLEMSPFEALYKRRCRSPTC
ncbi:Gag protease polyprotein [Gossypium australe]|uniref:Gag protease polyprotein n=1 Tax=Gossypium australe TaxID=47621 RepID=A0A5B6W8G6_9ROSI|nr:Gag protease polyprotein [Gossypium australe]